MGGYADRLGAVQATGRSCTNASTRENRTSFCVLLFLLTADIIMIVQGTWQFMSVALLTRNKPVEICDELEAFLHVIIYYASRYLHSNCNGATIACFLDAFFDTYTLDGGRYVCGTKKSHVIEKGQLIISTRTTLRFGSPMDKLLTKLLSWFRAHLLVTDYELKQAREAQAQLPPTNPTPLSISPSASVLAGAPTPSFPPAIELTPIERALALLDEGYGLRMPSPMEYQLSALLRDHTTMEKVLNVVLTFPEWTMTDKAGDKTADCRVTEDLYDSTVQSTMTRTAVNKKVKRTHVHSTPEASLASASPTQADSSVVSPGSRSGSSMGEQEIEE